VSEQEPYSKEPHFKGRALFKGHDTRFGIFYPTNYIIAVFDSYETARHAERIMLSAGYSDEEVDAMPPDYVVSDIEKGTKNATLLKRVEQRLFGHFGSDATFWEDDLEMARQGAGFLAVFCPTEHEAERVLRLLRPEKPKSMRRYERFVIEDLV
jgi:hypothetical protein